MARRTLHPAAAAAATALLLFLFLSAYQTALAVFLPGLTMPQSHTLTVLIGTASAAAAADAAARHAAARERLADAALRDANARLEAGADLARGRRAEEELRRAKEAAEAASRSKGEFLANMNHEIRTPMNGVLGMTELLLETPLTAEQRRHLRMIQTSAHSLLRVVNDILDSSKIKTTTSRGWPWSPW